MGVFVMLHDFRKMQLSRFSGVDPAQDPYAFLKELEKLCIALGCDLVRAVGLVSSQLYNVAYDWYKILVQQRTEPTPLA
ncbi:DNA/RNA polymerases superfamily protein [Quillaja saponaria]|uniref:DNA/RNA polymerases superfamily protein n=1 Tax=Quillaja saponaria TaxID=32244 RepID=A0AAD7L3C4_QUISA|nr:DNA/RNA polymerases superfamily protein [Quillaja saponaria]